MHERTERAIARMTFVFCCALPTLCTLLIIFATWTPWWHHRSLAAIESRLSTDSGLVVRIEDFRRVAPSTLYLNGVELFEPETGREVGRVREIRWAKHNDEVSIVLQQPELQSAQLQQTWEMIHERFLCRPEQTAASAQLAANDLTIHSRSGSYTLRDVDAWIRPGLEPDTVEATIQCLPAQQALLDPAGEAPISISVTRDRGGAQPSTSWVLSSGQNPLPCSALAEYLHPLEQLGNETTFSGTMRWRVAGNRWELDLGGSRFESIDLGRWCEQLPHRCTGTAALQLERCRLVSEKDALTAVDIAGSLRARDGLAGASLLKSAEQHLGFAIVELAENVVAYDRLAIGFNINGPLLQLEGICQTERGYEGLGSGVVLCSGGHSLAEISGRTLPAAQLQAMFAPRHSVMVPLSRQTSPLMKILMPPSRPAPVGTAPQPRITSASPLQSDDPSIGQPK